MWQPIGDFNSPDHHNVVLLNWARITRTDIGRDGWKGKAFFVTSKPSCGFCIETRGPGIPSEPRMHFPFDRANRLQRREQFARAWICFQGGYVLGDYPGKVSLAERVGIHNLENEIESFGSGLRGICSGGLPAGYDNHILDESFTWQSWLRVQRNRFNKMKESRWKSS